MKTRKVETDALGFPLTITIRNRKPRKGLGRYLSYEDPESGKVRAKGPHSICISPYLSEREIPIIAAHEVYHFFYAIRHLITCDEETEAEVFGDLVGIVVRMASGQDF